jgi:hypothetical protein
MTAADRVRMERAAQGLGPHVDDDAVVDMVVDEGLVNALLAATEHDDAGPTGTRRRHRKKLPDQAIGREG